MYQFEYFLYNNTENLRNRYSQSTDYSGIKILFKNGGSGLQFEDSSNTVSVIDSLHPDFMKLSMASSDFMNYKFLASIFDFSNSQENEIFNVLVKEVFPFLNFRDSLILDDETDSHRIDADYWWKYLSKPQDHVPTRKNSPSGAYIVSSSKYKSYQEKLEKFNKNLKQELSLIFNDANNKLKNLFKEEISIKRSTLINDNVKEFGHLKVDFLSHQVWIDQESITLTNKEYLLLEYLVNNHNVLLSREQIIDVIWGYEFYGESRVVDTSIKNLRKKLGKYNYYIQTIIKGGYRFKVGEDHEEYV